MEINKKKLNKKVNEVCGELNIYIYVCGLRPISNVQYLDITLNVQDDWQINNIE